MRHVSSWTLTAVMLSFVQTSDLLPHGTRICYDLHHNIPHPCRFFFHPGLAAMDPYRIAGIRTRAWDCPRFGAGTIVQAPVRTGTGHFARNASL